MTNLVRYPAISTVNTLNLNKRQIAITLLLLLSISILIVGIPIANAAVVEVDPVVFVMTAPNPVGVNQRVLVSLQMDKLSPTATGVELGEHFTGFKVKITRPDGTTEEKGPFTAFATSGYYFYYTPTQLGKYTFQASFPGQWINTSSTFIPSATAPFSPNTQYYFKPTTSKPAELTVQTEQIMPYPDNPLPTDYWTRPINAESKGWSQIADNWLMEGYDYRGRRFPSFGAFAPYSSAPDSPHVVWKRQMWFGGIGGGKFGDKSYYTGLSYEQPYLPLILNGRIIYSEHPPTRSAVTSKFGTRCLDLYTGEQIWFLDGVVIDFAQVLSFDSPNEHGLIAHLWTQSGSATNTTYQVYDGFTGRYQFTITNATSGQTAAGPNGEILSYAITGPGSNRRLILWNSTKAILDSGAGGTPPPRQFEYYSPPQGVIADGRYGIQFNKTMPNISGAIKYLNLEEKVLITHDVDPSKFPFVYVQAAYDTTTGDLLWTQNRTNIYGHYAPTRLPYSPTAARDGIIVILDDSKSQLHGYDIRTGNEIWITDIPSTGWTYFDQTMEIAYGKVYLTGYDGFVRAFDTKTGQQAWEYYLGSAGYETAYGTWPVYAGFTIADEKLFFTNDDHSPDSVIWRGGKLYALDVNTGKQVWNISGWLRIPAVADGYLTAENSLDGQIYTFGKGSTKTTVSGPQTAVPKGTTVLITGTVTDQSPASKDTPAISDEDMSAWMEYLHMQKPKPTNATGVQVKLTAIDPNGNTLDVGEATSDIGGTYGIEWTPPVEGKYQITATFEGSNSYGSSYATTYLSIGPATPAPTQTPSSTVTPTTSPTITTTPPPPAGLFPTTEIMLAIITVVIVVAVIAGVALFRRKK